jgi:hypothetical protein
MVQESLAGRQEIRDRLSEHKVIKRCLGQKTN